jgi:hypothetical protein
MSGGAALIPRGEPSFASLSAGGGVVAASSLHPQPYELRTAERRASSHRDASASRAAASASAGRVVAAGDVPADAATQATARHTTPAANSKNLP